MTEGPRATLRLKPGVRAKALAGHPWVLAAEVAEWLGSSADGTAVNALGSQNEALGTGFYREGARVAWRRFRRDPGPFDDSFIEKCLREAEQKRKEVPSRRLIWAESDGMPGLVLDQYGQYVVAQITTLAMENHWPKVREVIQNTLRPKGIWVRRDASGRKLDGLPFLPGESWGSIPEEPVLTKIAQLEVWVDLRGGQKTGTYLDQQENYERVAEVAAGKKVLDLFCQNGGFALQAAQGGAVSVTGVDTSRPSLLLATRNAAHHGMKIRWAQEDATRFLRTCRKGEFDLVILDPPGFVKSRAGHDAGVRRMSELHRQALRVVARGGMLATFSCSHRVGGDELLGMVQTVAKEEGRSLRQRTELSQSGDHPVLENFPESRYLTGFLLEVG